MAYIALYRKWRPKTFEDVVGQRHITETLQKAIDTDKVAHAYLFLDLAVPVRRVRQKSLPEP